MQHSWVLAFLVLLQLYSFSYAQPQTCLSVQTYTGVLPYSKTQWTQTATIPQYSDGYPLNFIRFYASYAGNASYFFSFSSSRSDTPTVAVTPQLVGSYLGLANPPSLIDDQLFNLLLVSFDNSFPVQTAYNRAFPAMCPVRPSGCDVDVKFALVGNKTNDVTDIAGSGFVGSGSVTFGGSADGQANGQNEGAPQNQFIGTFFIGAALTIDYYPVKLRLEKRLNGVRQPVGPGPSLRAGTTATWTYTIYNEGTTTLNTLKVWDDQFVQSSCLTTTLAPCTNTVCTGTSTVVLGSYVNHANCTAFGDHDVPFNCTQDEAHYFGVGPVISITKYTNDLRPNGGNIIRNTPVTWKYTVTNTGNVDLTNVGVTDNKVSPVSCPATFLAVSSVMTCSVTGLATATALYVNIGSAKGTWAQTGEVVVSTDTNQYTPVSASISLVKRTNGHDTVSEASDPLILRGAPVVWSYEVTNTGQTALSSVSVYDDKLMVNVNCPSNNLATLAVMTCTATGTAISGQYNNQGSAFGVSPQGFGVFATYPSQYFGVVETISVFKYTNDVHGPPFANVLINDPVTWKYAVTNTGNVALTSVTVADTPAGIAVCPSANTVLLVGSTLTCALTGTAVTSAYTNVGSASGTAPTGDRVFASSPSGYNGLTQSISIHKYTNNVDQAVVPGGPFVLRGQSVVWTYAVTNTGNSALSSVAVIDGGLTVTCPNNMLASLATFTCSATGTAISGRYNNVGTATGISPAALIPGVSVARATVTSTYPSTYFGADQHISIKKFTNDHNTVDENGKPFILVGSPVTWTYRVTNTGNVLLSSVAVTDNQLAPSAIFCSVNTLATGAAMTCVASGTALPIDYANTGTANGISEAAAFVGVPNARVTATDVSGYMGFLPGISLTKYTNGFDTQNGPTTPQLNFGQPVTWTYVVQNVGVGDLSSVSVTDNQPGVMPACPFSVLPVSGVGTCTAFGSAIGGPYSNVGTAFGYSHGVGSMSTYTSSYYGVQAAISVHKYTNGVDVAGGATRPVLLQGSQVVWTYVVTNTGNVPLAGITVSDSRYVGTATCPASTLVSGAFMTCARTGVAISGDYTNVGTARGLSPLQEVVTASSPSAYFGVVPVISLDKFTNDNKETSQETAHQILRNTPVTWTYKVYNTGSVLLSSVSVVDNKEGLICSLPDPLDVGENNFCSLVGTALPHEYANVATALGLGMDRTVTATDVSFYNPVTIPGIRIIKRTNGVWTKDQPIPVLRVGDLVTWTYEVTNTGDTALVHIDVTDDLVSHELITCPSDSLAISARMTCSAVGTVVNCLYNNIGCADANGANGGAHVQDCSTSSYIGKNVAISIVKFTNHFSSDVVHTAPGPCIERGDAVWWHYVVSNTGDDLLTNVHVEDSKLPHDCQPVCPDTCLQPWAAMTCKAHGQAVDGAYTNIATAIGSPATVGGPPVTDSDQNWYRGVHASVRLDIIVNGAHDSCGFEHDSEGEGCSVRVDEEGHGECLSHNPPAPRGEGEGKGKQGGGEGHGSSSKKGSHGEGGGERKRSEPWSSPAEPQLRKRPTLRALLGLNEDSSSNNNNRDSHGKQGEGREGQGEDSWEVAEWKRENAKQDCQGEGCARLPRNMRRRCNAPLFGLGANMQFTFVIENIGSEDLISVQLSLDHADANGKLTWVPFTANDIVCPANTLAAHSSMACTVPPFVNKNYGRQRVSGKVTATGACDGRCVQNRDESHWFTASGEGEGKSGKGGKQQGEGEGRAEGRVFPDGSRDLYVEQRTRGGEGQAKGHKGSSRW